MMSANKIVSPPKSILFKMKEKYLTSTDGLYRVNYNEVKSVCISGSLYALMQYLLLFDEDVTTRHTCYFLGYGVSRDVSAQLPAIHIGMQQTGTIWTPGRWWDKIWLRLSKNWRYPFLKTARIYALDLGFASPLIGRRNYSLLSDGPLCMSQNMQPTSAGYQHQVRKHRTLTGRMEGLLYGPVAISTWGNNPQCKEFFMTEENVSPVFGNRPVHIRSLDDLWHSATDRQRALVRRVYAVGNDDVNLLNSKSVVFLTQPMIKDRILDESEYLDLLRRIFSHYDMSHMLLKLHPRDNFDYRRYFPEVAIYDKPVNMQLLVLLGTNVTRAVTICSSSVNSFPESVEVDWYGPDVHPKVRIFFCGTVVPNRTYNQMTL